jgi:ribonuclease G
MRLRNLSGQIIVDCLRLHNAEQRTVLQEDLKQVIANDPRAIALYGFTRLGLFEMTRERVGLPLSEILALQK